MDTQDRSQDSALSGRTTSSEPRLTAVITTTGRPALRSAVRSVLRQSVPVAPLLVLDDPDMEPEVRRLLHDLDFELVSTHGGAGIASARNLGVRAASTEYIALLDEHCEWVAQKSATQLATASSDTMIASRTMMVGSSARVAPEQLYEHWGDRSLAEYLLQRPTLQRDRHLIQASTMLCARELALEVPWRTPPSGCEEWDWAMRLDAAGAGITVLPDVLVRSVRVPGTVRATRSDWRENASWLDSIPAAISERTRGDFVSSVVARSAFAGGAWGSGTRHLLTGLRAGAHPAALLVGLCGLAPWTRGRI